MATDINSVVVSGHLTKDCGGDDRKLRFRIGSNRRVKKDGQWTDATSFLDVLSFQTGIAQYLVKGTFVTVKGTLVQESWEKDGERRSTTYIIADQIMFAPRSERRDNGGSNPSDFPPRQSQKSNENPPVDDDIPF